MRKRPALPVPHGGNAGRLLLYADWKPKTQFYTALQVLDSKILSNFVV